MRVMLVQLPTSHLGAKECVYPLGLSRLSGQVPSIMEKCCIDLNLHPDPWPYLQNRLLDFRPATVALSFRNLDPLAGHRTSYLSSLKTAARLVRHLRPDARLVAGGPAFSLFAERLMEEIPELDGGLAGEGEPVIARLLDPQQSIRNIPGIVWKKGTDIIRNPSAPQYPMDRLPGLDHASLPPRSYTGGNTYVASMGIEGKRGCDLNCGYCVYPRLGGRKMRLRPVHQVVDEMEHLNKRHNVTLFHFTDGVLNRPADHFEALCREISRRRLHVSWTGFFREDTLSAGLLDLAVRAGCVSVYFSADALTRHGRKLLNKQLTREDILGAASICAANGILTLCHFLINLPGELPEFSDEARRMLDDLLAVHAPVGNLGGVVFNTVRLYPDAPLTRKLIRRKALAPNRDLLYPVYYNPPATAHFLHELEAHCHTACIFSRLSINLKGRCHENSGTGTSQETIPKSL